MLTATLLITFPQPISLASINQAKGVSVHPEKEYVDNALMVASVRSHDIAVGAIACTDCETCTSCNEDPAKESR